MLRARDGRGRGGAGLLFPHRPPARSADITQRPLPTSQLTHLQMR